MCKVYEVTVYHVYQTEVSRTSISEFSIVQDYTEDTIVMPRYYLDVN